MNTHTARTGTKSVAASIMENVRLLRETPPQPRAFILPIVIHSTDLLRWLLVITLTTHNIALQPPKLSFQLVFIPLIKCL